MTKPKKGEVRGARESSILVNVTVARALLGDVSDRTMWYLLKTGQLESRKIGSRRMILRSSIVKFCKADHGALRPKTTAEAEAVAS